MKQPFERSVMPELTAPATDLSRGKSSALLRQVCETDQSLLIIKNSRPYAVILSYEKYVELMKSGDD